MLCFASGYHELYNKVCNESVGSFGDRGWIFLLIYFSMPEIICGSFLPDATLPWFTILYLFTYFWSSKFL